MRVEEYERHFMKMMRYALEDTNLEQKKQFWFLRGLHHGLRQGLKASELKSLRRLVTRAITLKDERRSREDHIKDMKRMGDRDHFDRSFQKSRDGSSNMKRGNFRSGINQHGSNFRGGNNYYSGGGSFNYHLLNGGSSLPQPSTPRPNTGGFAPTYFTCDKLGHKSFQCPDKKTATTPPKRRPQEEDLLSVQAVVSHPVLKAKPNALITCAPGSSYTHA
jgi:hypothetical protein